MEIRRPTQAVLEKELEAALLYFGDAEGNEDEVKSILEIISTSLLMLSGCYGLDPEHPLTLKQHGVVEAVVDMLHRVKLKETGSNLLGEVA